MALTMLPMAAQSDTDCTTMHSANRPIQPLFSGVTQLGSVSQSASAPRFSTVAASGKISGFQFRFWAAGISARTSVMDCSAAASRA